MLLGPHALSHLAATREKTHGQGQKELRGGRFVVPDESLEQLHFLFCFGFVLVFCLFVF